MFKKITQKFGGEEKKILAVLQTLEQEQIPIRMEVETTAHRFNSTVALRRNMVVIGKPMSLNRVLRKGSKVRFKVPNDHDGELQLTIAVPLYNLSNGNPVFLCPLPKQFSAPSRRTEFRYNTERFNNLLLGINGHPTPLRIINLSTSGCRVVDTGCLEESMPVNQARDGGNIYLGNKLTVDLDYVIPRSYINQGIGMEFRVSKVADNEKYLHHLIKSLDRAEKEKNRARGI